MKKPLRQHTPPELRRGQWLRRLRCRLGHRWSNYDPATLHCQRCGAWTLLNATAADVAAIEEMLATPHP